MNPNSAQLVHECIELFKQLNNLKLHEKVETINEIRLALTEHSPFKTEPVDCVKWVPNTEVRANE